MHLESCFGIANRRFDLCSVAHNAFVAHEAFDVFVIEPRNLDWIKVFKCDPKCLALTQDREPRQAGLETLEAQLFVQFGVVGNGATPFIVVVVDIDRIGRAPKTALKPIGAFECGGRFNGSHVVELLCRCRHTRDVYARWSISALHPTNDVSDRAASSAQRYRW